MSSRVKPATGVPVGQRRAAVPCDSTAWVLRPTVSVGRSQAAQSVVLVASYIRSCDLTDLQRTFSPTVAGA